MRRIAPIVLLFLAFLPGRLVAQDQQCFSETNQCISGVIRAYWNSNGGLPVFGYPITALATETNADGFTGPTQWFERDRLEDHTVEGKGVLAGRLGAQKLAMEGRPWETLPKVSGAPAGCQFFAETGHSLCQPFLTYWQGNGALARFGYPISEPVTERNASGYTGTFQWFERRRMESHPENQPPYHLQLGLLGNEVRSGGTGPQQPQQPNPSPQQPAPDACAGIAAPRFAVVQPNCIRYGDVFYVDAWGFQPNEQVGYWITKQLPGGDATVGTATTINADAQGHVSGTIDTKNYFGYILDPGNYVFVAQENAQVLEPSIAPFRVIPGSTPAPQPTATTQPAQPTATTQPAPPPPPPTPTSSVPSGTRIGAVCRDGTRSDATGSGACSHHGGVDHWIYAP